jgi:N-acetyl-anhydromuramyl-L-alanine amidase AmpD
MRFIQAKNFTRAHRAAVDWIIIHATDGGEGRGRALRTAQRFAGIGQEAPKASAHYAVDAGEAIQCVRETDVAWHCPGGNRRGIGIELCGRAGQTAAQWADADSEATLRLAAVVAATSAARWDIPIIRVQPAQLIHGVRGFAGHVDFTEAYPIVADKRNTHWDPGPGFPWDHFLELVAQVRLCAVAP